MKRISFIAVIASITLFLSSCLKDKNVEDQVYGMEGMESVRLIEFPKAPYTVVNLEFSTNDTSFNVIAVRLNSEQPAQEDIKITLVQNPTLIADYNAANGTNFSPLPATLYNVSSWTVTIPKGQREGYIRMTAKPSIIAQGSYALGLSISSVSGGGDLKLSQNYKDIVVVVGVKNKYDGIYRLNAYVFMGTTNTTAPYLVNVPCGNSLEVELATNGASSVEMSHQPVFRNGSIIYFNGLFPINVSFNPTTNKVTAVNNLGTSATAFPYQLAPATTYDSRYDPNEKKIYMRYNINPSGTWFAIDTLTFCRPR